MGSGPPSKKQPQISAPRRVIGASGRLVLSCDATGRAGATLISDVDLPLLGELELLDSAARIVSHGQAVATLDPGELNERIVLCMERGQRYEGLLHIIDGHVVVDARPKQPTE